jgi:hypothetical protein
MTRKEYLKKAGIKLNTLEFKKNIVCSSVYIDFGKTEVCREVVDVIMFGTSLKEYLNQEVTEDYLVVVNGILEYKEEYKGI